MRHFLAVALAGMVTAIGISGTARAQSLNGSGSSFIGPMMNKWTKDYERAKNVKVNYSPLGSGAGIRQFLENETDFGCTDTPLNSDQLSKAQAAGQTVLHIPLVLGGVVPAYNLPSAKEPLRLTGVVLADIFLGNIKKWDDPALKEINPGVDLPALPITVVHRADASGTTAIFTDYLSKVSKPWKDTMGTGTQVKWPAGTGAKGNEELAETIQRTSGAIGYVELVYALQRKLAHAKVKNRAGNFVHGSLEGVTAAAAALKDIPADLRFSLTNASGKEAYPISGATYAILHGKQSGERGQRVVAFLNWATHDGQESATDLFYARLPDELVQKIEAQLRAIRFGN